jgi:hypothetical protein
LLFKLRDPMSKGQTLALVVGVPVAGWLAYKLFAPTKKEIEEALAQGIADAPKFYGDKPAAPVPVIPVVGPVVTATGAVVTGPMTAGFEPKTMEQRLTLTLHAPVGIEGIQKAQKVIAAAWTIEDVAKLVRWAAEAADVPAKLIWGWLAMPAYDHVTGQVPVSGSSSIRSLSQMSGPRWAKVSAEPAWKQIDPVLAVVAVAMDLARGQASDAWKADILASWYVGSFAGLTPTHEARAKKGIANWAAVDPGPVHVDGWPNIEWSVSQA